MEELRYYIAVLCLCLVVAGYAGYRIVSTITTCGAVIAVNPNDKLATYFASENIVVDWRFRSSVLDIVKPLPNQKAIVVIDRKRNQIYWNGWMLFGSLREDDERISVDEFKKLMEAKFGSTVCIRVKS
jgi:hypothetical protein